MTEEEWKELEGIFSDRDKMFLPIFPATVVFAAYLELKERREDEKWLFINGYCLSRLEKGWALLYDGKHHTTKSIGPTIHAAIEAAKGKEGKD